MERVAPDRSREAALQLQLLRMAHRDLEHAIRLVRRLDRLANRVQTREFRLIVNDLRMVLLREVSRSLRAS